MKTTSWSLIVCGLLVPLPALAQQPDTLPPGVTQKMVTAGDKIFHGNGICFSCHGADAKGISGLGANLTDDKWIHSKGTYDDIVHQIITGVSADQTTTGAVMPPKGGSSLSDEQVREVAAYVWSLSHHKKGAKGKS